MNLIANTSAEKPARSDTLVLPANGATPPISLDTSHARMQARPLGINTLLTMPNLRNITKTQLIYKIQRIIKSYELLAYIRNITRSLHNPNAKNGFYRITRCHCWGIPMQDFVKVLYDVNNHGGFLANVETCNAFMCPKCGTKLANRRRNQLHEVLISAQAKGYLPVMLTNTVRHDSSMDFESLRKSSVDIINKTFKHRSVREVFLNSSFATGKTGMPIYIRFFETIV